MDTNSIIESVVADARSGVHKLNEHQQSLVRHALKEFAARAGVGRGDAEVAQEAPQGAKLPWPHPVFYVRQFHQAFGHPINDTPTVPDAKLRLLRVRLLAEELAEFCAASGFPIEVYAKTPDGSEVGILNAKIEDETPELINIVEAADALGDINVVTNGAALVWGIPIEEVDAEISRSNMSKLGEDGKPIYDEHGKIQKGPNYVKPDIAKLVLG